MKTIEFKKIIDSIAPIIILDFLTFHATKHEFFFAVCDNMLIPDVDPTSCSSCGHN